MCFAFWLCGSPLLDCADASPAVDHLLPVRSPAKVVENRTPHSVSVVVESRVAKVEGPDARANVCDLPLNGDGNVPGTFRLFCKTHGGMASACVRGGAIFAQASKIFVARRLHRMID